MGTKILIKQGGIIQNGSTYVPCEFNDLIDGGYYFFDILEMVTVNFDHQCFTHFGGLKHFFGA